MTTLRERTEGGGLLGLLFGVLLACIVSASGHFFGHLPLAAIAVFAVVAGVLGWRYGDAFFSWFLERLRYFL